MGEERSDPSACPSLDTKCSTNTEDGIMNYAWYMNPVMWYKQWQKTKESYIEWFTLWQFMDRIQSKTMYLNSKIEFNNVL